MKFKIKSYNDIAQRVKTMTIRELLSQVCCPDIVPGRRNDNDIRAQLLFMHPTTYEKIVEANDTIKKNIGVQPVVMGDLECGSGCVVAGMPSYPSFMAVGETGDDSLAYKVGRLGGEKAYKAGFRWSLAPCCDVILNPNSPITSIRAVGEDTEKVIKICSAYINGQHDSGIASTIKHFPGDGCTEYDQHITTSVNRLSLEEWYATYGKVYKALIEEGAMSVMPGHISLPCYDDVCVENGLYPPATISYKLMTQLLKEELGFEGIICSDAVTMGGFSGFVNYYKACALFLKNGGDILLFAKMNDIFVEKMTFFVNEGFLPREILEERARRVMCFIRQLCEMKPQPYECCDEEDVVKEVVEKSVKIVRDRKNILPIKKNECKKILHASIMTDAHAAEKLNEELLKRGLDVEFVSDMGPDWMYAAAESGKYSLIICSCSNAPSYGTNIVHTHGPIARNMMRGWSKLDTKTVFVSFYHPYFHKEFEAAADTVINTYGTVDATYKCVADKIFED